MSTLLTTPVRERFVGELTDAALEAAARHGVRGSSVDYELRLGKALGRAVGADAEEPNSCGLLADVTDAAYRATLEQGFSGSFLDLEMDLWHALGRVAVRFFRPGRPGGATRRGVVAFA
jgi:hypothetical protein